MNKFIPPKKVISPKIHLKKLSILYDEKAEGVSIAYGLWDDEESLLIRWNGDNEGHKMGNPQSSGHPTWFKIPYFMELSLLENLVIKKAIGDKNIIEENFSKLSKFYKEKIKH